MKVNRRVGFLSLLVSICLLFPGVGFPQSQEEKTFSVGGSLEEILGKVENSISRHIEVLKKLWDKAPKEAKPFIEYAIELSRWGKNTAVEAVELAQTPDPLKRASLYEKYAQRRVAEIKRIGPKGRPEFLQILVKDYEEIIQGMMKEIEKAKIQGKSTDKALKAVEKALRKHTEVLKGLLEKVPEKAKEAIAQAIEVSKHGRDTALKMLGKRKRGRPGEAEKPRDYRGPEGVGKPRGRGRS